MRARTIWACARKGAGTSIRISVDTQGAMWEVCSGNACALHQISSQLLEISRTCAARCAESAGGGSPESPTRGVGRADVEWGTLTASCARGERPPEKRQVPASGSHSMKRCLRVARRCWSRLAGVGIKGLPKRNGEREWLSKRLFDPGMLSAERG
jgi:hypothetical protein